MSDDMWPEKVTSGSVKVGQYVCRGSYPYKPFKVIAKEPYYIRLKEERTGATRHYKPEAFDRGGYVICDAEGNT